MTNLDSSLERHRLAEAMLQINEQLVPVFDAADGVRADLERRGWSPAAAEAVALQWLSGAMAAIWKGQS